MMAIRDQARHSLGLLNPSPVFLRAYEDQRLPEDLDIYVGCPEEFFLAPDTLPAYTEGRLIPLLDDGNFGLVTFYDPASGGLVQKDVESPHEVRARFANWQQYLADLLIRIAESIDDDVRLRRVARLIGFHHYDELLAFFDSCRDRPPAEEYNRRKASFLEAIHA
jgi:hypothetical protein